MSEVGVKPRAADWSLCRLSSAAAKRRPQIGKGRMTRIDFGRKRALQRRRAGTLATNAPCKDDGRRLWPKSRAVTTTGTHLGRKRALQPRRWPSEAHIARSRSHQCKLRPNPPDAPLTFAQCSPRSSASFRHRTPKAQPPPRRPDFPTMQPDPSAGTLTIAGFPHFSQNHIRQTPHASETAKNPRPLPIISSPPPTLPAMRQPCKRRTLHPPPQQRKSPHFDHLGYATEKIPSRIITC